MESHLFDWWTGKSPTEQQAEIQKARCGGPGPRRRDPGLEMKVGDRFGSWTVTGIGPASGADPPPRLTCRCHCGAVHAVRRRDLLNGRSFRCPACAVLAAALKRGGGSPR